MNDARRVTTKTLLRESLNFVFLLVFVAAIYAIPSLAVVGVGRVVEIWSVVFIVIIYGTLLFQGWRALSDAPEGVMVTIRRGIFLVTICTALFGVVSFTFLREHFFAGPRSDLPGLWRFIAYYWWVFLDTLPGLKVSNSLAEPLTPSGYASGVLVVSFRAVVIYGVLRALKDWWRAYSTTRDDVAGIPNKVA